MASSHQKTVLNFDPVEDGPINTLCSGDGQTQKLWHIQPSSSCSVCSQPLTELPLLLPQSLELLSTPVSSIETQKHIGTLTTALQTMSNTNKNYAHVSSKQTSQPLSGYWLLLSLWDGQRKANQYLHTVMGAYEEKHLQWNCLTIDSIRFKC